MGLLDPPGYSQKLVDSRLAFHELCSRMEVRPSKSRRSAIRTLITSLVMSGIWGKLDGFYLLAAHDAQAAKLNWTGAGQNLVAVNAPIFTVDRGFTGDGATSYLDTGLAGTAGEGFLQDSATLAVWVLSNSSSNTAHDVSGGGNSYINTRAVAGGVVTRINSSSTSTTVALNDSRGLTSITRSAAASVKVYRNGGNIYTGAEGSVAPSSIGFQVLRNQTSYSDRQVAFACFGAALGDAEHASLYAAMSDYLTAAGAI